MSVNWEASDPIHSEVNICCRAVCQLSPERKGSSEGAGPPHHDWQRFADHVNVKQHCVFHIMLKPTKNLNQQAVKPTADLWTLCCRRKSCFLLLPHVKKVSLHMIKIVSCVSWSKCIINAKCIVWFALIKSGGMNHHTPHDLSVIVRGIMVT